MRIRNLVYSKCDPNVNYPISTENVVIQIGENSIFFLSGSFATSVNLTSPIMVKWHLTILYLLFIFFQTEIIWKCKFVVWIDVPCKKYVGSCTYKDLCSIGYPENKECPSRLKNNNVPCRCAILQVH